MSEWLCSWDLAFEAWLLWGFACYGVGLVTMGTLLLIWRRAHNKGKE